MRSTVKAIENALDAARKGLIRGDPAGMAEAEVAIAAAEKSLRGLKGATPAQLVRIRRMVGRLQRLLDALLVFRQNLQRVTSLVDDAMSNYSRQPEQSSPAPGRRSSCSSVDLHG